MYQLGQSSTYCLVGGYRFAAAESVNYQTGRAGTLVSCFDRYQTSLLCQAATPDFVVMQDTMLIPEAAEVRTADKLVLFCPEQGGSDDWARVCDELYARYREQLGAPPERPLEPAAMILGWGPFAGIGDVHMGVDKPERPDYYRWVADNAVPRLAELGFKRVMIVLGMAPLNWPENDIDSLCPEYADAFKYLCDRAHTHGMGVIAWYGTAQNLDGAKVWQEHPEFIPMGRDGKRCRAYYSPWGWPGFLPGGYADYTLALLEQARELTGLDGLWLDSYAYATHVLDMARMADEVAQADALLPWQARIEDMGYYTYCEGVPYAIGYPSTSGWGPPEDWARLKPETLYKQGLYLQQNYGDRAAATARFLADPQVRYYYRMLANRCCPILDMGHFGDDTAAMELIAQANRDFNAVSDLMVQRTLLGERGVEWSSDGGRAVFVFENMKYQVAPGMRLTDVTEKRAVRVRAGGTMLQAYHTYRLEP